MLVDEYVVFVVCFLIFIANLEKKSSQNKGVKSDQQSEEIFTREELPNGNKRLTFAGFLIQHAA